MLSRFFLLCPLLHAHDCRARYLALTAGLLFLFLKSLEQNGLIFPSMFLMDGHGLSLFSFLISLHNYILFLKGHRFLVLAERIGLCWLIRSQIIQVHFAFQIAQNNHASLLRRITLRENLLWLKFHGFLGLRLLFCFS